MGTALSTADASGDTSEGIAGAAVARPSMYQNIRSIGTIPAVSINNIVKKKCGRCSANAGAG